MVFFAQKQGINQIYKKIISSEGRGEIKSFPLKNVLFGTFATEQDIPVVIYVLGSEPYMPLVLVPRLGREFNISDRFGVALEAGLMILLVDSNREKQKLPDSYSTDLDLIGSEILLPSAGFKLYYIL